MKKTEFKYSLRYAFDPKIDNTSRTKKLLDFCKKAKIDDVMFFISAEDLNIGHISIEQAKPYVDYIKSVKVLLQEIGVTVSLNPWTTLGHGDRGRSIPDNLGFNNMVDIQGNKATLVVCPLSKSWRNYFANYMKYLCAEISPEVLWFEDDMRMSNHHPLKDFGCFCNAHMALYCKKLNIKVSRKEFTDGILSGNVLYREVYREVNKETFNEFMAWITQTLKDEQKKFGLMTSDGEIYRVEGRDQHGVFKELSKQESAYNRMTLMCYREKSSLAYGWEFNTYCLQNRSMLPTDIHCVGEIENFPMTSFSKTAAFTEFQMKVTMPLLLSGQTLDIFEFNGNGVVSDNNFVNILKNNKEYYNAFFNLKLKFSSLSGINILCPEDTCLYNIAPSLVGSASTAAYLGGVLSGMGFAIKYICDKKIKNATVAISGDSLKSLSDEEIAQLVKHNNLIINGDAALYVQERGLNNLFGIVKVQRLQECGGDYAYEECAKGICEYNNARSSTQFFCGDFVKIDYSKNQTVYSNVYNAYGEVVAPAITLAGNIAVLPYCKVSEDYPLGLFTPVRANTLNYLLKDSNFLGKRFKTISENTTPYLFECDEFDVVIINNFSLDSCSAAFETDINYYQAEQLGADGIWNQLTIASSLVKCFSDITISPLSNVIFKLFKTAKK